MHSLKNTIVAVGLLGLSFLFYQASTKPNPNAHLSDEVPPLSISDGIDGFTKLAPDSVTSGIEAVKSKLGDLPNIQMPDLSKPKQMVTDMASEFKNQLSDKATQLKEQVTSGVSDFQLDAPEITMPEISAPQLEAPEFNSPEFNAPEFNAPQLEVTKIDAPQPQLQFNAPTPPPSSQNLAPIATEQPTTLQPSLDTNVRDQGLIAALKAQAAQRRNQPADSANDFLTEPSPTDSVANSSQFQLASQPDSPADSSQFQFASQPIPSGDSSFNRLAADSRSSDADSNVFQASTEPANTELSFEAAWDRVDQLVEAKDFTGALGLLSQYYRHENISGPQRERLNGWLDALAGKVIFSTEHHLEGQPFTVGNESLTDISSRWGVPAQLIYNINKSKIANPAFVDSGTELKVVRGPFNVEVDMSDSMMTLFLGDLYAGRYPVKIGISGSPKPGEYRVLAKSTAGHSWRDAAGNEYPPSSPQNGYGPNWIGLSGSLCIHGIKDGVTGNHAGCLGLSAKDSKDVFGILSKSSTVKIMQ